VVFIVPTPYPPGRSRPPSPQAARAAVCQPQPHSTQRLATTPQCQQKSLKGISNSMCSATRMITPNKARLEPYPPGRNLLPSLRAARGAACQPQPHSPPGARCARTTAQVCMPGTKHLRGYTKVNNRQGTGVKSHAARPVPVTKHLRETHTKQQQSESRQAAGVNPCS
jgi:hypothetical protein